jgi:MFS family permease
MRARDDAFGQPAVESGASVGMIAARIDRLPLTRVQWELAILTQLAWGFIISGTDGIAARLYPFIWKPHHVVTSFQYSTLYALEVGIGILIGDYLMGFVSDRYGRRPATIAAALLAGAFVWPFAFVTNFWALAVLSVLSTLGVGAILSTHATYITEIVGHGVRNRVLLASQGTTALVAVVIGLMAFYWIPSQYQLYVYLLAAAQLVILLPLLYWRLPESPRWLEAKGRHAEAERIIGKMEERCRRYGGELTEPDPSRHPVIADEGVPVRELLSGPYGRRIILLLVCWILGYAGIIYGVGAYSIVYIAEHAHGSHFTFGLTTIAGLVTFAGFLFNASFGERAERRDVILLASVIFCVCWAIIYVAPTNATALVVSYLVSRMAGSLWLFNMYNYTANAFPTRIRSAAFGWADGLGHLGAWGGAVLAGHLYSVGHNHLGWFIMVTIFGAMLPSIMLRVWGLRQSDAILEELST